MPRNESKDLIESLVDKKTFRNSEIENISSIVERNRKTSSITDSDILKSLIQTSFDILKVAPRC